MSMVFHAALSGPKPGCRRFIISSTAAEPLTALTRQRSDASSRQRSVTISRGITGVMVFGSGVFFQWIEGPAAPIQKLVASLYGDPRHYDIVSLDQSEEKRERLYPNWDMERVEVEDICIVLMDALESSVNKISTEALMRILKQIESEPLHSLGRR